MTTIWLPHGPSRDDRRALTHAIARSLEELPDWLSPGPGSSSVLILETSLGGQELYVQFLATSDESSLLCEFASGFYGKEGYRATPAQRAAMVSHGFSDGSRGNFSKELDFDVPDAAMTIAERILTLLGDVFGWIPGSRISATTGA